MTGALLKEMNKKLQEIENLLILQLVQDGATREQISLVLKAKTINSSNLSDSLPLKKLQKKEIKQNERKN